MIATADGEKEIVVKTPDGEGIAKQMDDKAQALAREHKRKREEEKAKKKAAFQRLMSEPEMNEPEPDELEPGPRSGRDLGSSRSPGRRA